MKLIILNITLIFTLPCGTEVRTPESNTGEIPTSAASYSGLFNGTAKF